MICANCGANVPDGVKFCGVCGQPMPAPAAPVAPAYAPVAPVATPKKNNTMVIVLAAVAAAVVLLLLCLLLFGGGGAEAAFENYFAVKYEGDFSGIEDLQAEPYWLEEKMQAETLSDDSYSQIALPKLLGDNYAYLDSYDYEILLVDEYSETELAEFNTNSSRLAKGIMADDACTICVEIIYEDATGEEVVNQEDFTAYRYDGDWYLTEGDDLVNSIINSVTNN